MSIPNKEDVSDKKLNVCEATENMVHARELQEEATQHVKEELQNENEEILALEKQYKQIVDESKTIKEKLALNSVIKEIFNDNPNLRRTVDDLYDHCQEVNDTLSSTEDFHTILEQLFERLQNYSASTLKHYEDKIKHIDGMIIDKEEQIKKNHNTFHELYKNELLKKNISEKEIENKTLEKQKLKDSIKDVREQMIINSNYIQDLDDKITEAEDEKQIILHRIKETHRTYEDCYRRDEESVKAIEDKIQEVKTKISIEKNALKKKQEFLEHLKNDEIKTEQEVTEMQHCFENVKIQLEITEFQLASEVSCSQNQIHAVDSHIKELEVTIDQVKTVKEEIEQITKGLISSMENNEQEISKMKLDLENFEKLESILKNSIKEINEQNIILSNEYHQTENMISDLDNEISLKKAKLEETETANNAKLQSKEDTINQITNEYEEKIRISENDIGSLEEECKEIQDNLKKLEEELKNKNQSLMEANDKYKTLLNEEKSFAATKGHYLPESKTVQDKDLNLHVINSSSEDEIPYIELRKKKLVHFSKKKM